MIPAENCLSCLGLIRVCVCRFRAGATRLACVVVLGLLSVEAGFAIDYPTRTITIVVPFVAGGSLDTQARLIAAGLGERLGKPVIVENRPGAGGSIGTGLVAHAPPDGYTLLMGVLYLALEPALRSNLGYDPLRDFAPVAPVAESPLILVVPGSSPAKTIGEFLAHSRSSSESLSFGSPGLGTAGHVLGELFKARTRLDMVHVPYKGEIQAVTDSIGGRLSMMFVNTVAAMPQIRSGRLRALGVTGAKRLDVLADVPTLAEAGVPGLDLLFWSGVPAPAGTPVDVVHRLHEEIAAVTRSAIFTAAMENLGATVIFSTPRDFGQRIRTDSDSMVRLAKETGLQLKQ
jgi:tripartite-type tricarboxylate transporter receptor subunit TctC